MATPQQPELRRSGDNALVPGDPVDEVTSRSKPRTGGETGPVPEENLPGHHPDDEQDKPDAEDFVAKAKEVATRNRSASPATASSSSASSRPAPSGPARAARAPSATNQALAEQVVAGSAEGPISAPPAPALAAPARNGTTTNPLVTIATLQWKVATFPLRVAIGAVGRIRRLL